MGVIFFLFLLCLCGAPVAALVFLVTAVVRFIRQRRLCPSKDSKRIAIVSIIIAAVLLVAFVAAVLVLMNGITRM